MSEATTTEASPDASPQERPTPSTESQATTQEQTDPNVFIGKDFDDPHWGKKARNITKMHEQSVAARKKAEKAQADQAQALESFWARNPDLAEEARKRMEGKSRAPADTDEDSETTETDSLKAQLQALTEEVRNLGRKQGQDSALTDLFARLGGGDVVKGEEIYRTQGYDAELQQVAETWNKGTNDRDAARMALELVQYRRQAKQPKPPEPRPSTGTAAIDTDRGAAGPMPEKTGDAKRDAVKAAMEELGVKDVDEWRKVTDPGELEGE